MTNPHHGRPATRRLVWRWLAVAVTLFVIGGIVTAATGPLGAAAARQGSAQASENVGLDSHQQSGPLSGEIERATARTTLVDASANDTFGSALAHGDVNGDGVEDVVVGAPLNDTANGNNSGAVYVFYGPVNEGELNAAAADVKILGADGGDRAGYSVATGDVNDDDYGDVVVGAPLEDRAGNASGSAYVVPGGNLSGTVSLVNVSRNAAHQFVGAGARDNAGISVATVARPGGDDVLVGALFNDSTAPDAGAAYVVSDVTRDVQSLTDASATLVGEGENDRAGWSVASAGDFDGDGNHDVLVGAPKNNSTGWNAGAAYVVTANVSGTVSLADAQVKLVGVIRRDNAGWAVASAGDVNGDDYGDIVVGAPFNDSVGPKSGIAYVAYGGSDVSGTIPLADAGVTLVGEGPDDLAGYSVSSGDVTCDAYADVLVGAPGHDSTAPDAGAAYVVAGSETSSNLRTLSSADAKLVGESEGDEAGRAVSDGGDVTGNDDHDVLVGAPFTDTGGVDAGSAYVVEGDCPEE